MQVSNNVQKLLTSCLKELSDIEFQQRVWVDGLGPEVSSFDEVSCQLFDDTGLSEQLQERHHQTTFTQEIDDLLFSLGELMDSFSELKTESQLTEQPTYKTQGEMRPSMVR